MTKKPSVVSKSAISTSNMNGKQMALFSFVFLGIGFFIMGVSQGLFWKSVTMNAPKVIVFTAGLAFFIGGCSVFLQAINSIRKENRTKKIKKRHPTSPELWDYEWNSKGITNRSQNTLLSHFLGLSIVGCFYFITYWLGFINKDQFRYPFYGMSFFVLLIALWFFTMITKRIKYGKAFLKFQSFPFKLGQEMRFSFQSLPPKEKIKEVLVAVRFYEEFHTKNSKGQSVISIRSTYEDFYSFTSSEVSTNRTLDCTIQLPEDLKFESKLSEMPAHFWEVQIQCDIEGVDYREYFLLPVYS